jgi:KDO2-lipid IV(A) lauroyltransferase
MARLSGKMHKTAETNLRLCFPELNEKARKKLLSESFISVGMAIFETAFGWWGSETRLKKLSVCITGLEYLEQAQQQGKGIILCSPHFTTLELTGRLFANHVPLAVMYRPQKNPLLEWVTRSALEKHYQKVIARHEVRGMLRWLAENKLIWYAPDIDAGLRNSVFVPFFGVAAATITATPRYAELSGAPIIPAFFYRRKDNSGYDIILKPALADFPSNSIEADAARINSIFEEAIRIHPSQYLWQYKRFKTRPPGEARFYK